MPPKVNAQIVSIMVKFNYFDCLITYKCFFPNTLLVLIMSQSIEILVLVVLQLFQSCPEVVLKVYVAYSKISRKFPFS